MLSKQASQLLAVNKVAPLFNRPVPLPHQRLLPSPVAIGLTGVERCPDILAIRYLGPYRDDVGVEGSGPVLAGEHWLEEAPPND